MKIISLLAQKGGAGKTTLSLNLAIAAVKAGKSVVVIDLDPQQSSARWSRLRTVETPVIISAHGPNLPEVVDTARRAGADLVVIDTAPKSESISLAAAKLSDLVIIPCQPSNLDLDAIADTVNIVALAKAPACIVLSLCRSSTALADHAEEALEAYDLPIAPVRIASRVAFIKSLAEGKGVLEFEPSGSAAASGLRQYRILGIEIRHGFVRWCHHRAHAHHSKRIGRHRNANANSRAGYLQHHEVQRHDVEQYRLRRHWAVRPRRGK